MWLLNLIFNGLLFAAFMIFTAYAIAGHVIRPATPRGVSQFTWRFCQSHFTGILATFFVGTLIGIAPTAFFSGLSMILGSWVQHALFRLVDVAVQAYIAGLVTTFWLVTPVFHLQFRGWHGQN